MERVRGFDLGLRIIGCCGRSSRPRRLEGIRVRCLVGGLWVVVVGIGVGGFGIGGLLLAVECYVSAVSD